MSKPPSTESRFGWRVFSGHAAVLLLLGAVVAAVLSQAIPEPTATAVIVIVAICIFALVVWGSNRPR
jgi:membrane protein YdbS with pleckstrin-like domain